MIFTMIGQALSFLPIEIDNINYIKLENGIYDDFYITEINEESKPSNEFYVPDIWDKETYLHAKFEGNLFAGNTDFGVENTTHLIIKRRELGEYKWMPIIEREVSSSEDFNFTEIDRFVNSHTDYEYAAVPIIKGEEGTYSISEPCEVEFDNLVIMDKDGTYSTMFDIEVSVTRNNTSTTITPISGRYPIYVANADNDYDTGNIGATFINTECNYLNISMKEVVKFRKEVLRFLNNRKIKYIKDPLGRSWIASIGNAISEEDNGHPYAHKISFDFVEIGDTTSNKDMRRHGFLDIGEEWWI